MGAYLISMIRLGQFYVITLKMKSMVISTDRLYIDSRGEK